MKKLLLLLLVSFLTVSCNDETSFKVSEAGDNHEIIPVSFDDFKSNPENYYGKYVKTRGDVRSCRQTWRQHNVYDRQRSFF